MSSAHIPKNMLNENYSHEASRSRTPCRKSENTDCFMSTSALLNYEVPEAEQDRFMYDHQGSSNLECFEEYKTMEDHASHRTFAEQCGYPFPQNLLSVRPYVDFNGQTAPRNQQYMTTFEPQTVLGQVDSPNIYGLQPLATVYDRVGTPYGPEHSPLNDTPSSFTTSSYSDVCFVSDGWQTPNIVTSATTENNNNSSIDMMVSTPTVHDADDFDPVCDKPYARLIWEALMQAPGHRMMLRDIYDWFIMYTNKPGESGTNGWQNSIRHNLSMNQAFENDKSNSATSKGTKKANSVWLLTKDAIQNGVQSTTRYRKTGAAKKGSSNHPPAAQRQRSGAKGGRAARRAARLRRQEEHTRKVVTFGGSPATTSQYLGEYPLGILQDQASRQNYCPSTPTDHHNLGTLYTLPPDSYQIAYHLPSLKHESEGLSTYTGDAEDFGGTSTLTPFFDITSNDQYTDVL